MTEAESEKSAAFQQPAKGDEHFFEVELKNVVRFRNDLLLNEADVSSYLSQVAPVPFSPVFRFGEELHTTSNNLLPNGRRDALEFNIHAQNLFNKLQPLTKQIATKCRVSSAARVKANVAPPIVPFETQWQLKDADIAVIKILPSQLRHSFLDVAVPIFNKARKDFTGEKRHS